MVVTAVVEPHEKMRGLEVPDAVVTSVGGGVRARRIEAPVDELRG